MSLTGGGLPIEAIGGIAGRFCRQQTAGTDNVDSKQSLSNRVAQEISRLTQRTRHEPTIAQVTGARGEIAEEQPSPAPVYVTDRRRPPTLGGRGAARVSDKHLQTVH